MAQYFNGTVNTTQGSSSVTGVNTLWLANASVGDYFSVTTDVPVVQYQISSVDSDTSVVLSSPYQGSGGAGQNYRITRNFTSNYNLPLMEPGDSGTASLYSRAMNIIDGALLNNVSFNAVGLLSTRSAYDNEPSGFIFFAEDTDEVFILSSTPGSWSGPFSPFPSGWSPAMSAVIDGSRVVLQVSDWIGGEGAKPVSGLYVSAAGLTSSIGLATDIRGGAGPQGAQGAQGVAGQQGVPGLDGIQSIIDATDTPNTYEGSEGAKMVVRGGSVVFEADPYDARDHVSINSLATSLSEAVSVQVPSGGAVVIEGCAWGHSSSSEQSVLVDFKAMSRQGQIAGQKIDIIGSMPAGWAFDISLSSGALMLSVGGVALWEVRYKYSLLNDQQQGVSVGGYAIGTGV